MSRSELRETSFLILAAVAGGPRHGYAIIREILDLWSGATDVSPATMYSALERLAFEGLISNVGAEVVDGRNRRYYLLTDAGADLLAAEIRRLRLRAAHAEQRLRTRNAHCRR